MPNIKKKKKPAKINTGRYSRAELDRIKAARLKHVKTPAYFMSDEYKKKVLAGRKKKPAGDEVTDFLKRTPLSKTTKTPPGSKKKAAAKKAPAFQYSKVEMQKIKSARLRAITKKNLAAKKPAAKKAPVKAVSKAKPSKPVASKKKKKRSLLGKIKQAVSRTKSRIAAKRVYGKTYVATPSRKGKGSPKYGKGMSAGGPGKAELPAAAARSGKIRKGVKKAQYTTKGKQLYPVYGKKSKAAKSFRSAFKSGCAGGSKSFSWDGRSYSCKKK